MDVMEKYITKQYDERIEPYINLHMNYSDVALARYKERFIQGGPPTDYEFLFNDLELWNILTFKVEGLGGDIKSNQRMIKRLQGLIRQIQKELDKEQ
jgi:hypothetical protein